MFNWQGYEIWITKYLNIIKNLPINLEQCHGMPEKIVNQLISKTDSINFHRTLVIGIRMNREPIQLR